MDCDWPCRALRGALAFGEVTDTAVVAVRRRGAGETGAAAGRSLSSVTQVTRDDAATVRLRHRCSGRSWTVFRFRVTRVTQRPFSSGGAPYGVKKGAASRRDLGRRVAPNSKRSTSGRAVLFLLGQDSRGAAVRTPAPTAAEAGRSVVPSRCSGPLWCTPSQ